MNDQHIIDVTEHETVTNESTHFDFGLTHLPRRTFINNAKNILPMVTLILPPCKGKQPKLLEQSFEDIRLNLGDPLGESPSRPVTPAAFRQQDALVMAEDNGLVMQLFSQILNYRTVDFKNRSHSIAPCDHDACDLRGHFLLGLGDLR
jgi:hypothetical protein